MNASDHERALKQSVQEVLGAKEQLRVLAERVKSYPEAAERLGAVCSALDRVARGLAAAAEAFSAQDVLMRQAVNRLNETSHRMEAMGAEILDAIKGLSVSLDNQKVLVEKAANKRGFSF